MSAPGKKMTLTQATMLVAGNMIGTGIFLLPVNLAHVGSISIYGWLIATAGAAALGLVFARLGQISPQQGGPYAYARDFYLQQRRSRVHDGSPPDGYEDFEDDEAAAPATK